MTSSVARGAVIDEQTLTIGGVPTRALRVGGTGPVVLMVHGFTDSADTWRGVLHELARQGRAAMAIDLPGHGRAGVLPPQAGLAGQDDFLREAVDLANDGSGVLLVGNSMGALLALRVVARDERAITGVLALAPPGDSILFSLRALPTLWPILRPALRLVPVPTGLIRFAVGHLFTAFVAGGRVERDVRTAYAQHLDRNRLLELLAGCAEVISEITLPDRQTLLHFTRPVTLWWGTKDRVCPARGATRFGADAHVVVTPGAPHSPQLRQPRLVVDLIADHEARRG